MATMSSDSTTVRPRPCFIVTEFSNGETQSRTDIAVPGIVDECPRGTSTGYAMDLRAFFASPISALPVEARNAAVIRLAFFTR